MPQKIKRKRGAPRGNRNAVKHGYYSRAFNETEQIDLVLAAGMEGINEEIALLRFEIKKAVSGGDIKNLVPLVKATDALEKLIRTHHKLYLEKQDKLKKAVENVFNNVLAPLAPDICKTCITLKLSGKEQSCKQNQTKNN